MIATFTLLGQALGRQVHFEATEHPALRAMGFSRGQLAAVTLVPAVAVSIAGGLVGSAVAVAASGLFPIGPSRIGEPHPGLSVDIFALGIGSALIVLVLTIQAAVPAIRHAHLRTTDRRAGRSGLAGALASVGASPPAVVGVRLATEPGRGTTAVPTRATLISAIIAVTAVVGSLTLAASLHHLIDTPRLFGWNWGPTVELQPDDASILPAQQRVLESQLAGERAVTGYGVVSLSRLELNGRAVPAIGLGKGSDRTGPVVVSGRRPGDGAVALGLQTRRRLGVHLGDQVIARSGGTTRPLRVVGRVVLPGFGTYSGADKTGPGEGALVTMADLEALGPQFNHLVYLIETRPGTDDEAFGRRMGRDPTFQQPAGVRRPADITSYARLRNTPSVLAGLLAALALATVTHALAATVRRRRRDFALLKTLGFSRSQVRRTIAWQASTICVLALAAGLPLGIAVGRLAWRGLADGIGIVAQPAVPVGALLLGAVALLVVGNLAGLVPGGMAARVAPAAVLRDE